MRIVDSIRALVALSLGLGLALAPDSGAAWVRNTWGGTPVKQCDGKLRIKRHRRSIPDASVEWEGYRNGAESWNHLPETSLSVLREPASDAAMIVSGNRVNEVGRVFSTHYLFEDGLNGRTKWYADLFSGCIQEADVLIKNTLTRTRPTRAAVQNNYWATMIHELGHAVGLDHSNRLSMMTSGFLAYGYRAVRGDARGPAPWANRGIVQPLPDDQNAVEAIYPPSGGGYSLPNLHVVGQYRVSVPYTCLPGNTCKSYELVENFPIELKHLSVSAGTIVPVWLMTCNNGGSIAGPYVERVRLVPAAGGPGTIVYSGGGLLKDPGNCTKHRVDLQTNVPPALYNIVHEVDPGDFLLETSGHEEDDNVVVFSNVLEVK